MARISQKTIEQIQDAADILDVVGEYVSLQPAGKNHKGLCPFHNEKTPSFFVSKERNLFHCFGCGEKGNAITFIQRFKNLSYVESLEFLADKYHIEIERTGNLETNKSFDRYYQINEEAMQFYQIHLTNMEKGKTALEYLNNRGLDIHTIQYFEIGYAPKEMDALYQHLRTKYQEIDLLTIGLIKKNQAGNYYDLFRDRIVFPIKNESGRVVGFSGRLYELSETEPKYVNSPFTDIFTKGEILYNLDKAQPFIRREKRIVLYEGFMDVIASVKSGVKEAVCSMGTQLTEMQANMIKKYSDKVLLCYDGDKAGFEAMSKAIKLLGNAQLEVSIVLLPEGMDPDEFVKQNSIKAFSDYLQTKQIDVYEFLYLHMKKDFDLSKASQVEMFKLKIFDFLLQKASGTITDLYLQRMAQDIGVEFDTFKADFNNYQLSKAITKSLKERKTKQADYDILDRFFQAEKILLNYYLYAIEYRKEIDDQLAGFFTEDKLNIEILISIQDLLNSTPQILLKDKVVSQFSSEKQRLLNKRFFPDNYEYSVLELEQCIHTLKQRKLEREIEDLREKLKLVNAQTDKKTYLEISDKILDLKRRKEKIWTKKK